MNDNHPIVIIGSGLAGYNVAREFRKLNTESELIIIADDAADFYSKPMLSNALAKNKSAADLAMSDADKMAKDLNAKILKHTRVTNIDPTKHRIETSNNDSIEYSQLVLALGASAINIPFAGNAAGKILTVNDLGSYADFRSAIKDKKKIAIIGAGLIGCEFADDLLSSEYDVSVLDLAELPLNRLLPEQGGEYLKKALAEKGVNWLLGEKTQQINFSESTFKIDLEKGDSFEVDVVLSAVGLTPNVNVASDANIKVNKGIVVNQFLKTNVENIYALGDCAEVEGLFLPYVMPLMNAARAIAKSLNGESTAVNYPAMPVMVKTPSCAVVVAPAGIGVAGEWKIQEDEHGVHAEYVDKNGDLQGFALVGKAVENKQALTKQLKCVL